jgi:hypothetical protein
MNARDPGHYAYEEVLAAQPLDIRGPAEAWLEGPGGPASKQAGEV